MRDLNNEMMHVPARQPSDGGGAGGDVLTITADAMLPYDNCSHKLDVTRRVYEIPATLISEELVTLLVAKNNEDCCEEVEDICDGTDACVNGWPSIQIRVSDNAEVVIWMGETWQPYTNDWRCVCPTAWISSADQNLWQFNIGTGSLGSLKLNRLVAGTNNNLGINSINFDTAANTNIARSLYQHFFIAPPSSVTTTATLSKTSTIRLGGGFEGMPVIHGGGPASVNDVTIPNTYFRSHSNEKGKFDWKKGVGWP